MTKTRSLFLINLSLVSTSQTKLILKITLPSKLIRWLVFEAFQKTRSTCFIGSKTLGYSESCFKRDKTLLLACFKHYINVYINA